jgi:hypothetical protein
MTTSTAVTFRPHASYVLIAGVAIIAVPVLLWLLWREVELATVLFLLFAVGLLLFAVRSLLSRVEVDEHGLMIFRPLAAPQQVQFRQLLEVSEEGRFQRVIVLLYHPLQPQGLVALDDLRSLALPAVEAQTELLELLQARTPR